MVRSLYSTAIALFLFFAGAGIFFAFAFENAEGGRTPLAVIWTCAVAPVLPVLSALLAMDVWSDERRTARIESLLTVPVKERTFVLGKFLGVWLMVMACALVLLASSLVALAVYAPAALSSQKIVSFFPGVLALAMQSALWCAASLAASAMFRHSAAAALVSVLLTCVLPRGIWQAVLEWAPQGRMAFGEMPLDAQTYDMASGLVSSGAVLAYFTLTVLSLFFTSKFIAATRFVGRGANSLRWSTGIALSLASALAVSLIVLFIRLDITMEMPFVGHGEYTFSARTRNILSDARGEINVTAFLSRKDARFRSIDHFLRALCAEADAVGGARIKIRYVDPHWDVGAAERLVRMGAREDSLVFERGRRQAIMPLRDGYGERICASAILRVAMPPQRKTIYWTRGHGECLFDVYGTWGMSDIARDLARDGYRNLALDIAPGTEVPGDCALIIVAGARSDFSRAESGWLDGYLRKGGRLLVLLSSSDAGGVASLLSGWGMRAGSAAIPNARTLSGTDVIVSDFSSHPVASPFAGSQIVLETPLVFAPSAAAEGSGADRVEFSELANVGEFCVAAATERGAAAGNDLAIRPTRVIAVGDAAFVMNGQLGAMANANRDFFLNCVAYLSGTDAITESGTETDRLVSGMDRRDRVRFAVVSCIVLPLCLFVAALGYTMYIRRPR